MCQCGSMEVIDSTARRRCKREVKAVARRGCIGIRYQQQLVLPVFVAVSDRGRGGNDASITNCLHGCIEERSGGLKVPNR